MLITRTSLRKSVGLLLFGIFVTAAAAGIASENVVDIRFRASDIQEILKSDEAFLIFKLSKSGTAMLKKVTASNKGRLSTLTIDGVLALRVTIMAEIATGVVLVPNPSPELRSLLRDRMPMN